MNKQEKIQLSEKIDQYIKGDLSQVEIDDLWKEFLKNPEWYHWFETELHLRSLIKKGKRPQFNTNDPVNRGQESVFKKYRGWIYAAAAAVLLAIGLQFFSYDESEPVSSFALTTIDQSNLAGADVVRSGDEPSEDLDIAINEALATAYDSQTDLAIEKFRKLLAESPNEQQQVRIEMNLGILYYNNGEYESAKAHFKAITEIEGVEDYQKEKSWWFLGNSLLNLDQPREARLAVFNAYSMNGRYQSMALSLLKKLDVRLGNIPSDEAPERLGE